MIEKIFNFTYVSHFSNQHELPPLVRPRQYLHLSAWCLERNSVAHTHHEICHERKRKGLAAISTAHNEHKVRLSLSLSLSLSPSLNYSAIIYLHTSSSEASPPSVRSECAPLDWLLHGQKKKGSTTSQFLYDRVLNIQCLKQLSPDTSILSSLLYAPSFSPSSSLFNKARAQEREQEKGTLLPCWGTSTIHANYTATSSSHF